MQVNSPAPISKHPNQNWLTRNAFILLVLSIAAAIAAQAQSHNVLARFENGTGGSPIDIVQGPDGNFYGVGITGGNNAGGSIFKATPAGDAGRLYVFCATAPCRDGKTPNGLVLANDGNFYGTARRGGQRTDGVVFRASPTGGATVIYSFCADTPTCTNGVFPEGELIQGSDGDLYGTAANVGAHNAGVVFKITLAGVFTKLYDFCSLPNCADGLRPGAGLVEARNGLFYGTTLGGGANGLGGTIFRISPSGKLSTLYSFCAQPDCPDGANPQTSLLLATDGNMYGATGSGGLIDAACPSGCGTVFRIPLSGAPFTLVHAFTGSEGTQVQKLIQATDGSFYGTARLGGSSNLGTLFKMDSAGSVSVLFNFCNAAACHFSTNPVGLIQSTNGLFYGTTMGPGNGTLFTYGYPPFITMSPSSGPVGTMVKIYGSDLSGATEVTFNGGVPATFTIVSPGEIDTLVPAGALFGPVKVMTPAAALTSNVVFRVTP